MVCGWPDSQTDRLDGIETPQLQGEPASSDEGSNVKLLATLVSKLFYGISDEGFTRGSAHLQSLGMPVKANPAN